METFADYVATLEDEKKQEKLSLIGDWISEKFPQLSIRFGWGQPMFTDHGTFIIAFSKAKKHLTVSPEVAGMQRFMKEIENNGYAHTDNTFRIGWQQPVDYELLRAIIQFNIEDKADYNAF